MTCLNFCLVAKVIYRCVVGASQPSSKAKCTNNSASWILCKTGW